MWNNSLQTLLVSIVMAVGVSLSGCNSSTDDVQDKAGGDAGTSEQIAVETTATDDNAVTNTEVAVATPQQGKQVQYDVLAWGSESVEPLSIDNLEGIQATLGEVSSTDENSLDYASNPAAKYRFMNTEAPYLDIIDSEKYLELGWYFANPSDSDEEKELSKNHAKKAYKLARQLMGDEGGKLVSDMLNVQIIKDKTIGGQKVELAKCEFYSCMLVINKLEAQANNN